MNQREKIDMRVLSGELTHLEGLLALHLCDLNQPYAEITYRENITSVTDGFEEITRTEIVTRSRFHALVRKAFAGDPRVPGQEPMLEIISRTYLALS